MYKSRSPYARITFRMLIIFSWPVIAFRYATSRYVRCESVLFRKASNWSEKHCECLSEAKNDQYFERLTHFFSATVSPLWRWVAFQTTPYAPWPTFLDILYCSRTCWSMVSVIAWVLEEEVIVISSLTCCIFGRVRGPISEGKTSSGTQLILISIFDLTTRSVSVVCL